MGRYPPALSKIFEDGLHYATSAKFCLRHRFGGGRRLECGKDDGGGLLDDFQALGEQGSIAVVEVDVVSGGGPGFQTNRFGDHKGDSLGLGLTHNLGCGGAALGLVQHLMRLC